MSPIHSIKNQYRGVNAHLHSYWQAMGGWSRFHNPHLSHLTSVLKSVLLPMGYTAELEPSLQIRRIDFAEVSDPQSDVTIYDVDSARSQQLRGVPVISSASELVMPVLEALRSDTVSEKEYDATAIYEFRPGKLDRGEPVAWIELLSPSNKPGGQDVWEYITKRDKLIEAGLVFVEMDYLHESAPTLRRVPNYRATRRRVADEDSHPYRIAVIDPRPDLKAGLARIVEFDVDTPIPTVNIPLNADVLQFDFGVPYRKTFEEMFYGAELVDYIQLPMNFDRYSRADQTRIARRMLAVLEAKRDGIDLEMGPFPVKEVTLEEALQQIEVLKKQL
jgi:hypothetical protein